MNNDVILGGKAEVAIGSSLIPAQFLGDITPDFEEGTRETTTLAGTRSQPSGNYDTAELVFTMFLSSMDDLKMIWDEIYNEPSGSQDTGNFILGDTSCTTRTAVPVNIHYTCDDTDDNDVHIYAGLVAFNFNPTYNESDGFSVEVTIYAQPSDDGYVRLGTGDLTEPSVYDVDTQETVPVSS